MSNILVNTALCNRCNICATVCVLNIIEKAANSYLPRISEDNEKNCFRCGHCESFCPEQALTLNYLTSEKIHIKPDEGAIDPQELSLFMMKRRSVRQYLPVPVDKKKIQNALNIARYAASSGNSQNVKWHVIYDTAEVKRIASLVIEWMRSILNTDHPLAPYTPWLIQNWDSGVDLICNDAPHLLIAHNPRLPDPLDDPTDAIIALTHFDIAAPAYGFGTCWAGFVTDAMSSFKPLQEAIGLPEGRTPAFAMMFGYPAFKITSIPRRKPVKITWR